MAEIQYIGRSCVRIRGKEGIVICDPLPKRAGSDGSRAMAHVVTLSSHDATRVDASTVKPLKERVFVVDGPGEYEVSGIMLHGIRTYRDAEAQNPQNHNTVYVLHLDELAFCHLGELGHDLTTQQIEELGVVDVLFVPAYASLTPAKLAEIAAAIEPRAIIPLYETTEQLDKLAHEFGLKEWSAQDKVTVTSSSLPGESEEPRIVVLQSAPSA
jgi:L-ascorbate metabolism protein UlaG (beta-lactamase superfamily)